MARKKTGEPIEAGLSDGAGSNEVAAPKRRGRPKGTVSGEVRKGNVFSIRGSQEWRDWVGRLADHNRLKVADVIDRALVAYARQEGFTEPAPRR